MTLTVVALSAVSASALGCKKGPSAEERESAVRKTIIGGESGKPIMGQFALKRVDARKVSVAMGKSSRATFELASSLAVKKGVYSGSASPTRLHDVLVGKRNL